MKKQDILTPIGLILGIGFVLFGISLGDVGLEAFISISSLAITVGGSFAAILVVYSASEVKLLIKMTLKSFTNHKESKVQVIDDFKEMIKKSRREGLLSLEDDLQYIEDDFLKKGVELVIDDVDELSIRSILTMKAKEKERRYMKASKMYKTWGAYAPAFGMIGTLIGLIQMLADLQSPDLIAVGMANALITTFYGALLANIILIPLGANLQTKAQNELDYREMLIIGILSLKDGDSLNILENRLIIFLDEKEQRNYFDRLPDYERGVI